MDLHIKRQFGGKITSKDIKTFSQSEHWNDGKFHNLETTDMTFHLKDIPKILFQTMVSKGEKHPKKPLPILPFNQNEFLSADSTPKFIWYGHSAILIRMENKTIAIDPMLGGNAAPISPFPMKRFSKNTLRFIDDFPEIDVLLMTHDHYDHLDYYSIQKLAPKVKTFFVALGVKRHLVKWGIPSEKISEFDWWDEQKSENITFTFTPTRHFSGMGTKDRFQSLWGGWVLQTDKHKIWFSGDGGYGKHFKTIGTHFGGFDFAFMECGQYSQFWPHIHLFPEETIRAAMDAKAQKIMPVHCGGFALAQHAWKEPFQRFVEAAKEQNMLYMLPKLGELTTHTGTITKKWWEVL